MVTFRNNNNRRPSFRGSNNNRRPTFRRSDDNSKFQSSNFQRKLPSRNNNNAPKLIEKYNDLAREALANEDKILSENYFQHADHFTRVQNEQESLRMARINSSSASIVKPIEAEDKDEKPAKTEDDIEKKIVDKKTVDKKTDEKKIAEKESAAS